MVLSNNNVHDCQGALNAYYADDMAMNNNIFDQNDFNFIWGGDGISVTGNTFTDSAQALYISDASNLTASGNTFDGNDYAVIIDGSAADIAFTSNTITNSTTAGVSVQPYESNEPTGVVFNNNIINGNALGMENTTSIEVNAENNWWGDGSGPYDATGNPGGLGDEVSGLVDYDPWNTAEPAVVWVDDDYTVSACGGHTWGYDAFANIQGGIDAVADAGTVNVYAGTYDQDEANGYNPVTGGSGTSDFNIFVNKSVTIQGIDSSGTPITDYDDVEAFVVPKRDTPLGNLSTFFVQGDDVTISGLDVTAYDDPNYNFKTISVIGDNATIKNCNLHNLDQVSCIYMYDPRYNSGTDTSYITSYRFEGNYLDMGGINASGIRISSGPGWSGSAANRVITGNDFQDGSYGD